MTDSPTPETPLQPLIDADDLAAFIDRFGPSGGSERSKYQLFLSELAQLLGEALAGEAAPVDAKALSTRFTGGRKRDARVAELLDTLSELGDVQQDGDRYFMPKNQGGGI